MNESYELYHSETCGFCHRVRRYMDGAGWDIALKDTLRDRSAREALIEGGGRATVPCLKITGNDGVVWLYESVDIIDFLESRRAEAG